VADLVTTSGADIGVVFAPGGEQISVVDGRGRVLTDGQLLLALIALRAPSLDGSRVAVPVSASRHVTTLVESLGGSVVLTPTSSASIMAAAADPFMALAGDTEGRLIVPEFMPAFDAAATFMSLIDLLAVGPRSLADIVDEQPPIHIVERRVVTPWEQKGSVMRVLVEQSTDREVDLVDGVRIHHDDGWALVLPDPEDPVTSVIAEADSAAVALRLADEYVRRIEQIVRG
jgi:mannose-1-phosphate guanylyltransferase/phosphomannomutase